MKLAEVMNELGLREIVLSDDPARLEVAGGYCGDLLSDVMANAPADCLWFTIQGHANTVAVAQLKDIAALVLVNGIEPDPQTVSKARAQQINVLGSAQTSFELCLQYARLNEAAD